MKNTLSSPLIPISIGLVMIGFGLHQVTNASKWKGYIPKVVKDIAPVEPETIIKLHGTGNLTLGILYVVLHKNSLVRWIVSGWWLNVMLLCGKHSLKEGIRDLPIFLTTLAISIKKPF
jgi:hypothetical protein